jgi:endoglycosylceramidase
MSFSEIDINFITSLGMNIIRLGAMFPGLSSFFAHPPRSTWMFTPAPLFCQSGVEPVQGQVNQTYLDVIKSIVDLSAEYGIYTLVDFHQDVLSVCEVASFLFYSRSLCSLIHPTRFSWIGKILW